MLTQQPAFLAPLTEADAKIGPALTSAARTLARLSNSPGNLAPIEQQLKDLLRSKHELIAEKFIAITRQLDELVDLVVQIAGDLQKDADHHLRVVSAITVGVSIGLAGLVLVL